MTLPNVSTLGLWKNLPQVANVRYTSVKSTGNTVVTVPQVVTSPHCVEEAQISWGAYRRWKTTFKIDPAVWSGVAPTSYPKLRDTLVIGNTTWTVHKVVDQPHQGSPWRLDCTFLEIQADLAEKIYIQPPVDSTDANLSPLTTVGDTSSWDNLIAHIQINQNEVEDYQGIQFLRNYYEIWVANFNTDVAIGTLVTAKSGQYEGMVFRVISNSNIDNLDELERLFVTVDP